MISQKWLKLIKSLQVKKYRKMEQSFVVEGGKNVLELLQSGYEIRLVLATSDFQRQHEAILNRKNAATQATIEIVSEADLAKAGGLQTNNAALAIAVMKPNLEIMPGTGGLLLAMDGIQDPGNLGTIVRIADWYGIAGIICSEDTVDLHNPKTIAATMGSFTRVPLYYTCLAEYLKESATRTTVYGAFLEGDDVHSAALPPSGIVVMGNEAHGIRDAIAPLIGQKIRIPRYGRAESLNVGVATAIICDNWRRTAGEK